MKEKGICPHCGSRRLNKTGKDIRANTVYQRYYCRDCHRITTFKIETEVTFCDGITSVKEENTDVLQ